MPRYASGAMEKRVALGPMQKRLIISSSQEEALGAVTGYEWGDTHQGDGNNDETPSQDTYADNSSPNSLERVFDVTGSSLSSGASQGAVELVSPLDISSPSPRTTRDVALEAGEAEYSYNEAFESDRSQSPPKTVFWSLPNASHGCKEDGPKSPATSVTPNAVAVAEVDMSPLSSKLNVVSEVEVSNRPSAIPPEAACATIAVRAELLQMDQEAMAVEVDAEERSGRREGSATTREANGGGYTSLPPGSPALKPFSVGGKGFGSGSASAFRTLRRKEKDSQQDSQPPLSGEHHTACQLEGETRVRNAANDAVLDTLDQIANSVQVNMHVLDKMVVVEDDLSGKEMKSRGKREKSLMATVNLLSMGKTGAAAAIDGGGQCSPPSPQKPPRAVQEKLDKLRGGQSASKRARSESFNLLRERLRTDRDTMSASTVLEAIRLRAGDRPTATITAADLLKTALDVGISLPSPFHRNYFSG